MKLINNNVYLEIKEMVECGFKEGSLLTAKSKGTKCWDFIKHPDDSRKVLVGYEALSEANQEKVKVRFGNPYNRVARQPILNLVKQDAKAHLYYKQYRFGENEYLKIKRVNEYTRAASWLNMLSEVQDNRDIIKGFGLKVPEFYLHAGALIKEEIENGRSNTYDGLLVLPGDFPTTYQRMMGKVEKYKSGGYDYLIDPSYGNKFSAKLGKTEDGYDAELEEKQMAVIRNIASKHNNFDAAQVARLANTIFRGNNWNTISDSRTYQIMQDNKLLLAAGRRGTRNFKSTLARQMKREAPKFPTDYWTLDGWTVELLYQDETGYSNRLVMVVVLDAMNKYPVGYAIGERENSELIKQANRNAILHMQELFGDYYSPFQLQSDRYALKSLTPFYQAVSHLHTPAAVGNAKAKIIEPYFKYLNKEYCQLCYNWSGFNVDAKKSNQVNREALDMIKTTFPNKEGVIHQINKIIEAERSRKIEAYKQAWAEMPENEKTVLSQMDWLMVFGTAIGKTNSITGEGIVKVIDGCEMTFDTFDPAFRTYQNIDWQIIADEQNLKQVLAVSPDYKLRFVLDNVLTVPMGIRRTLPEHIDYRKQVEEYNHNQRQHIIKTYASDAEIAHSVVRDTPLAIDDYQEGALKLMFTTKTGQQKDGIQNAKGLRVAHAKEQKRIAKSINQEENEWRQQHTEYLNSKTDFNKYLY